MSDDDLPTIDFQKERDKRKGPPVDPRRLLRRNRDDGPYCRHAHFLVSQTKAEVECGDCKAKLDVWTVLRSLTSNHEHVWAALDAAKRERAAIEEEIKVLKKERSAWRKRPVKPKPEPVKLTLIDDESETQKPG